MELIKAVKRRSFWHEATYILLNIALAVGVLLLVRIFDQPYFAIILVLLSKWRIFAVRPRYWVAHIQSNLVDILVGLSYAALLQLSNAALAFQIVLLGLYVLWLLVLKPGAKRDQIIWQAGVAQFVSLTALASFSHLLPSSVFVAGVWLIMYAISRHVLSTYEEDSTSLLSITFAYLFALLAWLYYHWMIAYSVVDQIQIPQLAVVGLVISFTTHQLYALYQRKETLVFNDVRLPLLFMVGVIGILLAFTPWNSAV